MIENSSTPVTPVRPAAPYIGGKRNLSARLCALIDAHRHRTYVEPFVGMGGVFLRRARRPAVEVMNDISGDVANLYRILQRHYPQFMDVLKWQVTSREAFTRLVATDTTTLADATAIGQLRADIAFLDRLGDELTRPVLPSGAAIDYVPSQYLCEFIKKVGYDAVVYRSSVSEGINLALFDATKAVPGAVSLHDITKVSVEVGAAR